MSPWFGPALARLQARRGRTLLAAAGILAAAIMVGTAVTIAYGLETGFQRAASQADLPDLIARFDTQSRADVKQRVNRLADVEAVSYRRELLDLGFFAKGHATDHNALQIVGRGRRGYAIVAGSDLSGAPGEVVVEQGLANDWGLNVGDLLALQGIGPARIVGISVSPDDVAYPLTSRARAYVSAEWRRGADPSHPQTNLVLLWARDPSQLDSLLVQARSVGYGLTGLRFGTREGIQVLVDRATGLVIALLTAFSLVALAAAAVMLGASARADVQRRLPSIGIMRAIGVSRAGVVARYGVDTALIALPAAIVGLMIGALVAVGPSARLLEILNEAPPGSSLIVPLGISLVAITAIVAAATLWPSWRAASQPPATVLRGAETRISARPSRSSGGPFALGVRLAAGRRARTAATAAVIAAATGVVLLMLALASFLTRLEHDPQALDKRYELTATLPPSKTAQVAALPGVDAASPRYEVDASSSFELGEPIDVIAYPGDHTQFEAPPLAEGRRLRNAGEAEVGLGLANALGLRPGATLAMQLPSGREAQFAVVGVVRAIDSEGRIAYVRPRRLLAADPSIPSQIAVRLDSGADTGTVSAELAQIGAQPQSPNATAVNDQAFLGVLAGVLRVVALVNVLICLYALVQALAVTAAERRQSIAVLRVSGARRATVTSVLLGAAFVVVAIAAPVAIAVERLVLGPVVANLAAGYASLPLGASLGQVVLTLAGLGGVALGAAAWVARRIEREPIAAALRGE